MSPQTALLASQQLWPPPTFMTIFESLGDVSVTTPFAAAYARFTSSLRANIGCWPPVSLWQVPQRFLPRMFSHTLILNACTSAVAGAGPLYVEPVGPPLVLGLCSTSAPLPPLQAERAATVASSRPAPSARTAER